MCSETRGNEEEGSLVNLRDMKIAQRFETLSIEKFVVDGTCPAKPRRAGPRSGARIVDFCVSWPRCRRRITAAALDGAARILEAAAWWARSSGEGQQGGMGRATGAGSMGMVPQPSPPEAWGEGAPGHEVERCAGQGPSATAPPQRRAAAVARGLTPGARQGIGGYRVVVAPPLVSSEDLTSERTATPERAWASGLTLARSGSTSLGQSRARSSVCSPTRRGQGHPAAGVGEG